MPGGVREVEGAGEAVPPKEELAHLKAELEAKGQELDRLNDRFLRLAAEFENYKKRMNREREEFIKFANETLIIELLPILDNLERAVSAAKAHQNFQGLVEGVEMIHRLFQSILEKAGVRPMEVLGKPFDPHFHQAVLHIESSERPDNIVVEEVQRGYFFENQVLRPAMVKVSKVPAESTDGKTGKIEVETA